jgi:hypothetical protein
MPPSNCRLIQSPYPGQDAPNQLTAGETVIASEMLVESRARPGWDACAAEEEGPTALLALLIRGG